MHASRMHYQGYPAGSRILRLPRAIPAWPMHHVPCPPARPPTPQARARLPSSRFAVFATRACTPARRHCVHAYEYMYWPATRRRQARPPSMHAAQSTASHGQRCSMSLTLAIPCRVARTSLHTCMRRNQKKKLTRRTCHS